MQGSITWTGKKPNVVDAEETGHQSAQSASSTSAVLGCPHYFSESTQTPLLCLRGRDCCLC